MSNVWKPRHLSIAALLCGALACSGGADRPPELSYLEPGHLPLEGGTVILHGEHFDAGARVLFGAGASVGAPRWLSARELVAVAPAQAAGLVDVSVVNPDGQKGELAGGMRYEQPPPPPPPTQVAPVLLSVSPATGPEAGGTALTLSGQGFASAATVRLGGSPATVTSASATSLQVVAPPHAGGTVDVAVTNPDGRSATLPAAYLYLAPPPRPALASLDPASGPTTGGTAVILSGTGFASGATVLIDGAPAAVTGATATSLSIASPPHVAGSVDVAVVNPDGQASLLPGAYLYALAPNGPPTITAISPVAGTTFGGTTVSIAGKDLDVSSVTFGGVAATVTQATPTSLTVLAPAHAAGAVDVTVTNIDLQAATAAGAYTYVAPPPGQPAPVVESVSPASGPVTGGTAVVVTGRNFVTGSTVTFGGVEALVGVVGPASISLTAPPNAAGPVDVTVVNPDRQAAALAAGYTYVAPPPAVTALNVRGAPRAGGPTLTLAGTGLVNAASVTFGGAPASGLAYDPLTRAISVLVPPSPLGPAADGFVDVVVTNLDGQAFTWPGFHYGDPPRATGFTPDTGHRDDLLALTGSGFSADANGPRAGLQVSFGGTLAAIVSRTPSELVVVVPKMNPGVYTIYVTNFDGQFSVAPGTFAMPGP